MMTGIQKESTIAQIVRKEITTICSTSALDFIKVATANIGLILSFLREQQTASQSTWQPPNFKLQYTEFLEEEAKWLQWSLNPSKIVKYQLQKCHGIVILAPTTEEYHIFSSLQIKS